MSSGLPQKIIDRMNKLKLPSGGTHPFKPKLTTNRKGDQIIATKKVTKGPKKGEMGYVDDQGRIWIKDRSHAGVRDHWDVQIDEGKDYFRVDQSGNELP